MKEQLDPNCVSGRWYKLRLPAQAALNFQKIFFIGLVSKQPFLLIKLTSLKFVFQKDGLQFLEKTGQNIYITKAQEKNASSFKKDFLKYKSLQINRGGVEIGKKDRQAMNCFQRFISALVDSFYNTRTVFNCSKIWVATCMT